MNHFTRDMGIDSFDHTARAVETGYAVAAAGGSRSNTASIGAYPEMLRRRDQLAPRFGKWPATVIAAAAVLRRQRPLRLTIDGERVDLWSLFVGHCRYPAHGPGTS